MSIFRRESDENEPLTPRSPQLRPDVSPTTAGRRVTEIAGGTKVVGEISGSSELHIEGEVEGQVRLDSEVIVGATGVVRGEIHARRVKVGGQVIGNVRGVESVSILKDGKLEGDVVSPRMSIVDGAFFKGKVEMDGGSEGREPVLRPRTATPSPD